MHVSVMGVGALAFEITCLLAGHAAWQVGLTRLAGSTRVCKLAGRAAAPQALRSGRGLLLFWNAYLHDGCEMMAFSQLLCTQHCFICRMWPPALAGLAGLCENHTGSMSCADS